MFNTNYKNNRTQYVCYILLTIVYSIASLIQYIEWLSKREYFYFKCLLIHFINFGYNNFIRFILIMIKIVFNVIYFHDHIKNINVIFITILFYVKIANKI